MVVKEGF